MPLLLDMMHKTLVSKLRDRGITLCSDYAARYRVMGKPFPGPYSTKHHPWCKEMLDATQDWCACKAAQMGVTEVALNRCFFAIDIKQDDVMYVLPKADPDASDFSAARFTPALELSEHLSDLFSDANNVGHKRAGAVNLYVRGAQSRSGLKSVSAGLMIFDELDEMPADNVALALERTSGRLEAQNIFISTPTLPGFGVDAYYQKSTREHFFFTCPSCSKFIELDDSRSLVITAEHAADPNLSKSHYKCYECNAVLPHEAKLDFLNTGQWVKSQDAPVRGFQIPQLYSMAKVGPAPYIAGRKLKANLDITLKQEYENSTNGRPFVAEGARVEDATINALKRDYSRNAKPTVRGLRTLGVDVGKWLHWEVNEYTTEKGLTNDLNALSQCRQISHGMCAHFEELDTLMRDFQIRACVIDANPERRKAREFAARFPGFVYLCFYSNGLKGNEVSINEVGATISVDRTTWMDASIGRFNSSRIILPHDTTEEYQKHIKAVMRKYDRDKNGNPVGVWLSLAEDHFAHARTYAEIALPVAAMLSSGNHDIASFL